MTRTLDYMVEDGQGRAVDVSVLDREVSATVGGDATVVLRRTSGDDGRPGVPIGTRDAEDLELSVDGVVAPMTLGKGRLSRRSFRVSVRVGDEDLVFMPVTDHESALSRDGAELTRYHVDELGHAQIFEDGAQTPTATESALGVALAAAFGCGGRHLLDVLVDSATGGTGQP
jgi:hypothetical protein